MRFAVLSDYLTVRLGVRSMVESAEDHVVFEGSANVDTAADLIDAPCDGVLLDAVTTRLHTCLAICACIRGMSSAPPLVAIDWCGRRPAQLRELSRAGLSGCVAVGEDPVALANALHAVTRGQSAFLVPRGEAPPAPAWSSEHALRGPELAAQDARILELMGLGFRYARVAENLRCGESTVKHRVESVMRRHGLQSTFQLGLWAATWRLSSLVEENIEG